MAPTPPSHAACAELERLIRLPPARLTAIFADALGTRRRRALSARGLGRPLADAAGAAVRCRMDGSWPWAACGLVLRCLHEDDRICAALTCRAFRDALLALTEGVKKQAKSKT